MPGEHLRMLGEHLRMLPKRRLYVLNVRLDHVNACNQFAECREEFLFLIFSH